MALFAICFFSSLAVNVNFKMIGFEEILRDIWRVDEKHPREVIYRIAVERRTALLK